MEGDLGLKLTKAYSYLGDVTDHKQVIPFRRFSGGVGRASQAKEFGATQGVYFGSLFSSIRLIATLKAVGLRSPFASSSAF